MLPSLQEFVSRSRELRRAVEQGRDDSVYRLDRELSALIGEILNQQPGSLDECFLQFRSLCELLLENANDSEMVLTCTRKMLGICESGSRLSGKPENARKTPTLVRTVAPLCEKGAFAL